MARIACMWGIAITLLSCACGKEPAAPPAPPGEQPAGKVLAVDGEVTAGRASGGERRALAIDAPVWADDFVVAAAGASVQILLAHNGVTWTFEGGAGGARRRVDESVAWKAAKGTGAAEALAPADKDRTASAGRHTEGEAAGTAASVEEKKHEEAKVEAPPPAPEPEVADRPAPAKPKKAAPRPRDVAEGTGSAPPAPAPPPPPPAAAAPPPAPAAPAAEAAPPARLTLAVVEVGPGLDRQVVERVLAQRLGRVRACVDEAALAGRATLRLTVETSGAVTLRGAELAPPSAALSSCLLRALSGLSFPAPAEATAVTVRLDYAPR